MKVGHFSLIDHLYDATHRVGAFPAIHLNERTLCLDELIREARVAGQRFDDNQLAIAGNSFDLALLTYLRSVQSRPFWPTHRSIPHPPPIPENTALVISTSGSEGLPKNTRLGNAQLTAAAKAAVQRLKLGPGDQWLNCLPLYHIGGQMILWRCAIAGASVVLHEGFNPAAIAHDFSRLAITHVSLVPAMLARLLEADVTPPPSLRCAMIGGAALSQTLFERGMGAGWPLRPSYGMSETCAQIATWQPEDGDWREGSVGRVMPGHEIAISAEGRIRLRGPQLMLGYLEGGGLDTDGWFATGDLGQLDTDGQLTVLGRADDMLISGGRNVHPREVESCLAGCAGVRDVAVTGQPDPVWGDLVVALVVGDVRPDALLAHARQHLHRAALPRRIVLLDRLPRNAAGKLERSALRQLAREAAP